MPRAVRVLAVLVFVLIVAEGVRYGTPWLDQLEPARNVIYNGALLGSALLCLARAVLVPGERCVDADRRGDRGVDRREPLLGARAGATSRPAVSRRWPTPAGCCSCR